MLIRRCRDCRRARGDDGFTLTELLIVMLILGIILTPLAGAFVTSFKATENVERRIGLAFDSRVLAALWTTDVQSAEGPANPGGDIDGGVCGGLPTAGLYPLVTLKRDTLSSGRDIATLQPVTVSYVIEGIGDETTLVRRHCVGAEVTRTVVASDFGEDGTPFNELVYGATPGNAYAQSVCTDFACTISIGGRADYTLTIERRVPGEGTDSGFPPPPPPLTVTATGVNQGANVTWSASVIPPGEPPVLEYQVLAYWDDPANPAICANDDVPVVGGNPVGPAYTGTPVSASGAREYIFEPPEFPLQNNVPYCFRVRAISTAGIGAPSRPSNSVIPVPGPPSVPENVTVTPGDRSLVLTWTRNPNDGGFVLQGYQLTITPQPPGVTNPITLPADAVNSEIACPDSCLTNGQTYTLSLRAANSQGLGPAVTRTGKPYGPANAPTGVGVRGGGRPTDNTYYQGGVAYAQWSAPAGGALQGGTLWGFRIEASAPGASSPSVVAWIAGSGTTSGVVGCLTGTTGCLLNGRNYEIRVRAVTTTVEGTNCSLAGTPCTLGRLSPPGGNFAFQDGRTTVIPSGEPSPPPEVTVEYATQRDWTYANSVVNWTETFNPDLLPGGTQPALSPYWNGAQPVGYQVEFRRAYAWQVNGSTPLPGTERWTVPQVLGPQQLPGSPAPPPLATTGQTSIYEWQQLEGGYFYQVRIRALNRGEWFQGGDNSRIGPFSAWASRQPTDQPWSTAFYAVTKPDQPSINIQLTADPLNSQCVKMRWIGQGGQYRWEPIETGPDAYQHRNGLKYDYMRMAFHFEVVNRANPNQQIVAFDHLIPVDQAVGDIRYCNAAFTGNTRSVRVRPAYASWDSPGESLYNAALTNEGMIIGQYGPASNLVNVTA